MKSVLPTLEALLDDPALAATAATVAASPRSTIEPSLTTIDGARELVEGIRTRGDALAGRLRVRGTIGEGGMGVVRLAEQTSLGRNVAVKTLREDTEVDERSVLKMLQEAWITGLLEHPNVVPVHDVHVDEGGRPHIVLKRIEGRSWAELIRDPDFVAHRHGAEDLLEWNLSILAQLCNAVAFAHSRGIVHRDLKPENVMIGEFGEVYLLDWGLAVSLGVVESARFPDLSTATEPAGTPCYMAPEMLGGADVRISRATDVYLLGAILYEVVAGRPPHEGATFREMIASIVLSEPALPDDAPPELARIIRRAMEVEPESRFGGALELRGAVQDFLRHRGSERLSTEAGRRLRALASEIEASGLSDDPVVQDRLQTVFAECRFAYAEALRAWPENEAAAAGLRDATRRVVEHQLAIGQPRVAAASLAGVADPPADLRARVDAAVRAKDAEQRVLEQLGRDRDMQAGSRTRSFLALVAGLMWTSAPFVPRLLGLSERESLVYAPAALVVLGFGLVFWARESMTKTAINRFVAAAVASVIGLQGVFAFTAERLGVSVEATFVLTFLLWTVGTALVAFSVDRRLLFGAFAYFGGFAVAATWPELRLGAAASSNLVVGLVAATIWWPRADPSAARATEPVR